MSETSVVVLDAGHGGQRQTRNRGSSWNRAEGPNGLLEKDVVLDLALRTAARLRDQARVELTRSEDVNPSLAERAAVAKRLDAALFLSLHLNGSHDASADGTDVYVAPDSGPASRAFAASVLRSLRAATGTPRGDVGARDLGTITTSRHSPSTASCLAEIAYLSNPRQAGALAEEGYRNRIADALADAICEHIRPRAITTSLAVADGSPFVADALKQCWERCEQLRLGASGANAPNVIAARRVRTETGVVVDANPYATIGKNEIEAIIRAGFSCRAMPEVLLALWAKEGSTRSVISPVLIPQATTDANARSIFRSKVYYEDLGADYFLVTSRPGGSGSDNAFDDGDAAAPGHETHFAQKVAELVKARFLTEDISGAINRELTVSKVGGKRAVLPSTRFYTLSLLLIDALWAKLQDAKLTLLPSISDPMNYMQWNMGDKSFDAFLRSADAHRKEPRHKVNGQAISIEQWALHTIPDAKEYKQPRVNAIKFGNYIECYRPIFANALNLIKPGIEDLAKTPRGTRAAEWEEESAAASVETLGITTFPNSHRLPIAPAWKKMPIVFDDLVGVFPSASIAPTTLSTLTDVRTKLPGTRLFADPATSTNFFEVNNSDLMLDSLLFRATGADVEASIESLICYPSDPKDSDKLAASNRLFPVAVIVHGNTAPPVTGATITPTGPPTPVPGIAPPITVTPAQFRATGVRDNHTGYSAFGGGRDYLQEELARVGFVSMSISTNGANQWNLNIAMRANYIMQCLDQLRAFAATKGRFFGKLDFQRVALIGHSRGGDAVVSAVHLNAARPQATRYGIKSVVSIAPTDIAGTLDVAHRRAVDIAHVGHFLVVYGSHDGDITGSGNGAHSEGGSGFRLYDRSNAHRAMVFIHHANHDRFNRNWPDEVQSPPLGAGVLISRDDQEDLAKEYVVGWLRYSMLADWGQQNLFNGATANSHATPVSLMWKFGRDLKTIERYQDTDDTKNTLTGRVVKPAYIKEVEIDDENPPDPACHLPTGGPCSLPTFPHVDRVAKADAPTGTRGPLREEIPAKDQDFHTFTHLTFRVTKKYPLTDQTTIDAAPFPDFSITLEDTAGHRKTVPTADIQKANPMKVRPIDRKRSEFTVTDRIITKCNLETWKVPLSLFTSGTGPVSLAGIRAVEFDFNATAGQPIYIDTITLVSL
jgi:N-acetylmuramoyl-L-alanine amidase